MLSLLLGTWFVPPILWPRNRWYISQTSNYFLYFDAGIDSDDNVIAIKSVNLKTSNAAVVIGISQSEASMSDTLANALIEAIEDEYKARALYARVIEVFGEVRPFINIVEAEGRHIQALLPLFEKYGVPVPTDNWSLKVETPESLSEACQIGVDAEIENAEMYERLLSETVNHMDVQQVLKQLQRASRDNHLPAFQRCVGRGNSPSQGGRRRRGHRQGGGQRNDDSE